MMSSSVASIALRFAVIGDTTRAGSNVKHMDGSANLEIAQEFDFVGRRQIYFDFIALWFYV